MSPDTLTALRAAEEALMHSKPTHGHYPEPVERHAKALELVRAAIATEGDSSGSVTKTRG